VTVNLLIERFEKSVYYYLYLLIHASILTLNSLLQLMSDPLPGWRLGPAGQWLTPAPTYWGQCGIRSALSIPGLSMLDEWPLFIWTVVDIQHHERPYQHFLQHLQWKIIQLLHQQHHITSHHITSHHINQSINQWISESIKQAIIYIRNQTQFHILTGESI